MEQQTKCIVEVYLFDWNKNPADGRFVGATIVESEQPEHPDEVRDAEGKPGRDADCQFVYDEAEMKAYKQACDEAEKKAVAEAKRYSLSSNPWRHAHRWDDSHITSYLTTLVGTSKVWKPYMNRLLTIEECIKIGRHSFDHSGKHVARLWFLRKAKPPHRFVGNTLVETTTDGWSDCLNIRCEACTKTGRAVSDCGHCKRVREPNIQKSIERFEKEAIAEARRRTAYPDVDGLECFVSSLECSPTIWEPYMNRLLDEAESAAVGLF